MGSKRAMLGYAIGLAMLGGCSGSADETAAPPYRSGQRLRAVVDDDGHGATAFVTWRDTALATDCSFDRAADGELRCLPHTNVVGAFLDEGCTQPIVASWPGQDACEATTWATALVDPSACAEPALRILARGASLGPGPAYVSTLAGCLRLGSGQRFEVASEVPPSRFARATVVHEPRDGGLEALVATAEDGAAQIVGLWDPARGTRCDPSSFGGQTCVGAQAFVGGQGIWFTDARCEQAPPAVYQGCPETRPALATTADGRGYLVGARREAPVYQGSGESCSATSLATAYELGPEADPADYPQLATEQVGGGALRATTLTDVRGRALRNLDLVDATGTPCQSLQIGDTPGERRCVVAGATALSSGNTFADPGCTVRVWTSEAPLTAEVRVTAGASVCAPDRIERVERLVEHGGPLFSGAPGACSPLPREPALHYLVGGPEVDLDTLPRLTRRVE